MTAYSKDERIFAADLVAVELDRLIEATGKPVEKMIYDRLKGTLREYRKSIDGDAYSQSFEAFWRAYPRKKGKPRTYAAYRQIATTPELHSELMRALDRWSKTDQWDKGYIPYPERWLRDGVWQEDTSKLPGRKTEIKFLERGRYKSNDKGFDPTE